MQAVRGCEWAAHHQVSGGAAGPQRPHRHQHAGPDGPLRPPQLHATSQTPQGEWAGPDERHRGICTKQIKQFNFNKVINEKIIYFIYLLLYQLPNYLFDSF